ncbi:MAG TPA: hypothetical protein VGL91_11335 [Acidobacteriota bacterium]|jgi:hypothetical protein
MRNAAYLALLVILVSATALAQQITFFFPQIADGVAGVVVFRTTVILINNGDGVATGTIVFRRSDGSAFSLTLKDGRTGSQFSFQLQPKQTLVLESTGEGPARNGYALITSDRTIGGTAIFSEFDSAGKLLTEAGVPASPNLNNFTVFVDTRTGFNTGLAVANTGSTSSTLSFRLLRLDASLLSTTPATLVLGPNEQKAQFVTEFAEFGDTSKNAVGSLEVTASSPVSAVTLRTGPASLTTTPVVPRPAGAKLSSTGTDAIIEQVTLGDAGGGGVAITIQTGSSPDPIQSFIVRFMRGGNLVQEQIEAATPGQSRYRFVAPHLVISDIDQVQIRPVFASGLLGESSTHKK